MAAKRVVLLIGLMFVSYGVCSGQAAPVKPAAIFTLQIHAEHDTYKSGDVILVRVNKKNITKKLINCTISDDPDMYLMDVMYEGSSADETDLLKEALRPPRPGEIGGYMGSAEAAFCPPGKIIERNMLLTRYFKMAKPGRYTITFSEQTFPGEPQKNVLVRSNTITVTVLPADNPSK
jgi:hypothetical protein